MSANKKNYFTHRNLALFGRSDRGFLGEREVQTLLTMLDANQDVDFLDGKVVVDLGCGDQYMRTAIENRGASYRGIDIDECNLETNSFPLADNSADIVVCLAFIEHLRDPGHFFVEARRILEPGGVLWLSTPDIQACGAKFWNDPTHVHPYTRASLRTVLEMNGFNQVMVSPNYRCKSRDYYQDTDFNFFRARYLMPFSGQSAWRVPSFLKGRCTGLFALGKNSTGSESP